MKKILPACLLLVSGFSIGLVAGVFFGARLYEEFIGEKDFHARAMSDVSEPYVFLKILREGKDELAVTGMERRLEAGLLCLACCDAKGLTAEDRAFLSKLKAYLRERPLEYTSPEGGAKIDSFLSSLPDVKQASSGL